MLRIIYHFYDLYALGERPRQFLLTARQITGNGQCLDGFQQPAFKIMTGHNELYVGGFALQARFKGGKELERGIIKWMKTAIMLAA